MPDLFTPAQANKTDGNPSPMQDDSLTSEHISSPGNVHLFSAFAQKPQNLTFQAQETGEEVLLFLRRHITTTLPFVITMLVLLLIPLLILLVSTSANFSLGLPMRFVVMILLFYCLLVFSFAFVNFLNWFYNIFLVTTRRIIDINFSDLLYHEVAETKLNLVEEVNYKQAGFGASLFNYGDLFVRTAASGQTFTAESIPNPQKATEIIADVIGGPR